MEEGEGVEVRKVVYLVLFCSTYYQQRALASGKLGE